MTLCVRLFFLSNQFYKQINEKNFEKCSENSDNYRNGEIYFNKINKLSCFTKLSNLFHFFTKKIPDSLVFNK